MSVNQFYLVTDFSLNIVKKNFLVFFIYFINKKYNCKFVTILYVAPMFVSNMIPSVCPAMENQGRNVSNSFIIIFCTIVTTNNVDILFIRYTNHVRSPQKSFRLL